MVSKAMATRVAWAKAPLVINLTKPLVLCIAREIATAGGVLVHGKRADRAGSLGDALPWPPFQQGNQKP